MNCQQAQDILCGLDSIEGPLPAEVAGHLETCAPCQATRQRLVRLEQIVRAMPAELHLVGNSAGRETSPASRARAFWARRSWVAVAAGLVLGIGLAAWFYLSPEPASGPEVIHQLVSWNVDMADQRNLEDRAQTFRQSEPRLRQKVQRSKLSPGEKKLADQLLANGAWMSQNRDELGEAERFDALAHGLVDRMSAEARPGKEKALNRLSGSYCMVVDRGIKKKVAKLDGASLLNPDQKGRLARIIQGDAELKRKLKELLERSPNASRKEVLQALNLTGRLKEDPRP